jgi:hypothetical protein
MSGRLADGFEYLPTGQSEAVVDRILQAAGYYIHRGPSGGTPQVGATGRFGFGRCLRVTGEVQLGVQGEQRLVLPFDPEGGGTAATGFFGFGLFVPSSHAAAYGWVGLFDAVNDVPHVTMRIGANGVLQAYRGYPSGGTLLGTSAAGALTWDNWAQIELGTTIHNSAGTFQIRVNSKPVVSVIASDTQNSAVAAFDSIGFGCQTQGGVNPTTFDYYLDDLVLNDDQGAKDNTYPGTLRVKTQFGVSAGDLSAFTPTGAPTDWQAILNTLVDDTKYAAGSAIGDEMLAHLDAILGGQPVAFAQLRAFVRQDDATQRTWRNLLKIGATLHEGADHLTNQTFTSYRDIVSLNVDTGLPMIGTDLNAGQLGGKVQA